jgi:pimeloyl-ACP methyl ester carboxylesterase
MISSPSRRTVLALFGAAALTTAGGCATSPKPNPGSDLAMITIDTEVGSFGALEAGPRSGRPVLLLHGFPEFAIAWEAQLRALADAGYHAVAIDQRGYSPGVRPADVASYALDHPVADVLRVADALGWDGFDLVGHDWGAAVGWIVAAQQPARVNSLTAVAVPHLAAFADALRNDPAQRRKSAYMAMFRRPTPEPETQILAGGPPVLPGVSPERCAEYFRRLSEPGALTAALNWYRANDFTGYRQRVERPTLLIAGTDDETVAPAGVHATGDWVTGRYRLEYLDDLGHNLPEQAPAKINGLLLEHLSANPPEAP